MSQAAGKWKDRTGPRGKYSLSTTLGKADGNKEQALVKILQKNSQVPLWHIADCSLKQKATNTSPYKDICLPSMPLKPPVHGV